MKPALDRGKPDPTTGLRPLVHRFALVMEKKLQANDAVKAHWQKDGISVLWGHLQREMRELWDELDSARGTPASIALEAADVACLAMMIADVAGGLKSEQQTEGRGAGRYERPDPKAV